MAFDTIEDLNNYALGVLHFTGDVQTTIPEGTKVLIPQPTWDWARTTGDVTSNNLSIVHNNFNWTLTNKYQPADSPYGTRTAKTVTLIGNARPMDVDSDNFHNASDVAVLKFDGQSAVTVDTTGFSGSEDLDFNTGEAYAIEFWVYIPETSDVMMLYDTRPLGESSLAYRPWLVTQNRTLYLRVGLDTSPTTKIEWSGGSNFAYDTWHHIVVNRNTSGITTLYVDGINRGTTADLNQGAGDWISFGRGSHNVSYRNYLTAWMTDIRISDVVRYTTTFTPPTAPFTATVNDRLLIKPDSYDITYSPDVTITYDDYDASLNTNIVTTTGTNGETTSITITGLNTAEDWIGASVYMDTPRNYFGTLTFTTTVTNSVTGNNLTYDQIIEWENTDELLAVEDLVYNYYGATLTTLPVATTLTLDQIALVADDENLASDIYTINVQTDATNLQLWTDNSLASLVTFTGKNTSNITLVGTRENINANLKTLQFVRAGATTVAERSGNITWTLTPPYSEPVTVITQPYKPQYASALFENDTLTMIDSFSESQYDTLAYCGYDNSANPVFAYAYDVNDTGNVRVATHKIENLTGNIIYGEAFDIPFNSSVPVNGLVLITPTQKAEVGNISAVSNQITLFAQVSSTEWAEATLTINPESGTVESSILQNQTHSSTDSLFLSGANLTGASPLKSVEAIMVPEYDAINGSNWSAGNWEYEIVLDGSTNKIFYPFFLNRVGLFNVNMETYAPYLDPIGTGEVLYPSGSDNYQVFSTFTTAVDHTTTPISIMYDIHNYRRSNGKYTAYNSYRGNGVLSLTQTGSTDPLDQYGAQLIADLKMINLEGSGTKNKFLLGCRELEEDPGGVDDMRIHLRSGKVNKSLLPDFTQLNNENHYDTNITTVPGADLSGSGSGLQGFINSTSTASDGRSFGFNGTNNYLTVENPAFEFPEATSSTITEENISLSNLGFNNSLDFSGTSKLTIQNDLLQFDDVFTFEFHFRIPSYTATTYMLLTNRPDSGYTSNEFFIQWIPSGTNGKIQFGINGVTPVTTSSEYSVGSFHHLALVRNGSTVTLYVDGVADGTMTASTNIGNATRTSFYYGRLGGSFGLTGQIDNIRISDVQRYTSTFTPYDYGYDTDPNTVFNSLCDVLPLQEEFGALSNFTIEYYLKLLDTTNDQMITTNRSSTGYSAGNFYLQWVASTNKFQWGIQGETPVTSTGSFVYDRWYHIALQRRGSDFELFVNGVRQGRITNYTNALNASDTLYFGLLGSTLPMKGYLDELRISNIARWTSDGFIPSSPAPGIGAYLTPPSHPTVPNQLFQAAIYHWTPDSATLTMTSLDTIVGNVNFGSEVILDCDSEDYDYFGAWSLVYGGSDSRAYLFYTKSETDLAGNHVVRASSRGLFYRKLTINDDLSISVGSEVTVYPTTDATEYGWNMAIDTVRLANNMFINIIINSNNDSDNAHVVAIKTPYS